MTPAPATGVATPETTPSRKKPRGTPSSGCQVPGCMSDMSTDTNYNQRYKICNTHRQELAVNVNGVLMRFCQQCARLQPVTDFNEERRSCQARLEIHNKRRGQGAAERQLRTGQVQSLQCQVPGCLEDLLKHKAYNQRYKICPGHRAMPFLDIHGEHKRFCQQCARLQPVTDFDGHRRSCREKLEKHNHRRLQLKQSLDPTSGMSGPGMPKFLCQVPSCGRDLAPLKLYNIRYKVCADHLVMPEVMMGDGRMQRFCQQCARFQDVTDFDGLKKSCRARLEKHNERRRQSALQAADGTVPMVDPVKINQEAVVKAQKEGQAENAPFGMLQVPMPSMPMTMPVANATPPKGRTTRRGGKRGKAAEQQQAAAPALNFPQTFQSLQATMNGGQATPEEMQMAQGQLQAMIQASTQDPAVMAQLTNMIMNSGMK